MILQMHQHIDFIPKRIVSLVPSQTELLYYLGLDKETVGITKFCIHPAAWFRSKTRVGGTKTINISTIKKLQPDLIIANKEENVKEQIEELAIDHNVLVTDVNTIAEALEMILNIGRLTGKEKAAEELILGIKNEFSKIIRPKQSIPTAYLIWNKPYMTIGGDTFINDILSHAGLQNIFSDTKRYPEITVSQLRTKNCPQGTACELVLLSSEPYPFKQKHIDELQAELPGVKIMLVDGEMFSWYGSRMLEAAGYLRLLVEELN
jgi:ABC-type Fe3+-hydroxamate transport system substrate-binding protein